MQAVCVRQGGRTLLDPALFLPNPAALPDLRRAGAHSSEFYAHFSMMRATPKKPPHLGIH
ncbi:hypothetical protein CE205_12375 [Achromobacter insolitus]|nr:hypothetical protein MC81_15425 [Achromobacter insolitus]AXA71348.1 hypothetical protein CE205_12375 [Achromobacter insolitus]